MITKQHLRNTLRQQRRALNPATVSSHSRQICDAIIAQPEYDTAAHIACYLSAFNEVDLIHLIQHAWQSEKLIYVPVIKDTQMQFYPLTPATTLTTNPFGIKEPIIENLQPINPLELNLIVVPLVGFDAQRNRLGQGAGYYDRYLAHYTDTPVTTIGVAFEVQKATELPTDPWDISLDMIITERNSYTS